MKGAAHQHVDNYTKAREAQRRPPFESQNCTRDVCVGPCARFDQQRNSIFCSGLAAVSALCLEGAEVADSGGQ